MATELSDSDYRILEGYAEAVLSRYQMGEWDLRTAIDHMIEAFTLYEPGSNAFRRHAMFAIGKAGDVKNT